MPTRRQFVQAGVVAGTAAALGAPVLLRARPAQADPIPPSNIPKYVTPLFILPAMPLTRDAGSHLEYHVAQRRINAQVLPQGMPKTLVNGYGSPLVPSSFHSPSFTIENQVDKQTRVTWINQLIDSRGDFLPHLLTVDPTIHWANPPGGVGGRDSTPTFTSTPPPYDGPQPMIVHLHGTHDFEESDGLPETWFLPRARNIPGGFATSGTDYEPFKQEALERWGVKWAPGTLTSVYPNDQRAAALWFHDHVLGMTRLDVYTGLAGFYVLSGGDDDVDPSTVPGPRPQPGDPAGTRYYDIPLVLADKSFNPDGSLFFPETSNLTGPYVPDTEVPPYWNSSFSGTVSTVNGNSWPILEVEPRRYRFRVLDANNFRVYDLKVVRDPIARPGTVAVPTWVIGADGSLVPQAINVQEIGPNGQAIRMVTSERVDIIVDFTGLQDGEELFLINELVTGDTSNPEQDRNNVGQIMKFRVVPLQGEDTSLPPDQLDLPGRRNIGDPVETHRVGFAVEPNSNAPTEQGRFRMASVDANHNPQVELWTDPISQVVKTGNTALWEVYNFGAASSGGEFIGGGHAFHIHLVEFQLLNRQALDADGNPTGPLLNVQPWETGEKDTHFAPANQVTRFKAPFDLKSKYIYHCHFTDHEDHEMMRFFRVD
ncbi:MAG: multicopper oxidase domain-containing protein [Actinomadura sp.]